MSGKYLRASEEPKAGKGLVCLLVVLIAAVLLVPLFLINRFTMDITVHGNRELTLEYGSVYQEEGASARMRATVLFPEGFGPDVEVEISGEVDTHQVGTYEVSYRGSFLLLKNTAVRTVHVVDTQAPRITLNTNPDIKTKPGQAYQEEGFSAYDDCDGDITDRVVWLEKDGTVTYSVSDSSGNEVTAVRTIQYTGPTPPEITLAGGEAYTLYYANIFKEPGFTCVDEEGCDLTDQVVVTGEIDRFTLGTYPLTYTVTDSKGTTASVVRTVAVVEAPRVEPVVPEGKVIYLTFDDGPSKHTGKLLDLLDQYGVKATFFVVGTERGELMKEIVDRGHSIAIHSATHHFKSIYADVEAYFNDIQTMQEYIFEQTGVWTTLMRFPGGSSNTASNFNKGIMTELTELVQDAGFQYFDWNADSHDAGGATTSEQVSRNAISECSSQEIVNLLMHDDMVFFGNAIEAIIKWGQSNGYTFLPLESDSPAVHHRVNN